MQRWLNEKTGKDVSPDVAEEDEYRHEDRSGDRHERRDGGRSSFRRDGPRRDGPREERRDEPSKRDQEGGASTEK